MNFAYRLRNESFTESVGPSAVAADMLAHTPAGKKPLPVPRALERNEVKDLVLDYLAACRERGIFQVRLIHGKGIGNLRCTVHSILEKHPDVSTFTLDHPQFGGWGATIVFLRKPAT